MLKACHRDASQFCCLRSWLGFKALNTDFKLPMLPHADNFEDGMMFVFAARSLPRPLFSRIFDEYADEHMVACSGMPF